MFSDGIWLGRILKWPRDVLLLDSLYFFSNYTLETLREFSPYRCLCKFWPELKLTSIFWWLELIVPIKSLFHDQDPLVGF